jgi:phosphoenolpyruvate carboxylase
MENEEDTNLARAREILELVEAMIARMEQDFSEPQLAQSNTYARLLVQRADFTQIVANAEEEYNSSTTGST